MTSQIVYAVTKNRLDGFSGLPASQCAPDGGGHAHVQDVAMISLAGSLTALISMPAIAFSSYFILRLTTVRLHAAWAARFNDYALGFLPAGVGHSSALPQGSLLRFV